MLKSNKVLKGTDAVNYLKTADEKVKSLRATTADVAEGKLTFPKKKDDWEFPIASWVGRDNKVREYPCVRITDATGAQHDVALSAFRAKDEVETGEGIINCPNLCDFDAPYEVIAEILQKAKSVTLYRIVGKRNNRRGRYEYFTAEF